MNVSAALERAATLGTDTARLDVEWLLMSVLNQERAFLYTWPDQELSAAEQSTFERFLELRQSGMPMAYITGRKSFWSLDLCVNESVLIPRPETELLVETVLELCSKEHPDILDLGTGSGAIAFALASEKPGSKVVALDSSSAALDIARKNAVEHQLEHVTFLQSHWFEGIAEQDQRFDVIVSNPPYISAIDPHLDQGDVRFEPSTALISGSEGKADMIEIIANAGHFLREQGLLALEHGWDQGLWVRSELKSKGFKQVRTLCDLAGHERVSLGFKVS